MPTPSTRRSVSARVLQRWGNSLALRIPVSVARAAKLAEGQTVFVDAEGRGFRVSVSPGATSLRERLARFDPKRHGGELLAAPPVGAERP
ncbi:MAG: AbrB/MazE/SpoVT family DNA-binding domain-containing protein [Burkholderiales bacterium]|jgi:antitoxin MazE|nr:AbrB/MazE/SpoVT family DNA-binding domain-containing protein [Burkholderiales bacterium]